MLRPSADAAAVAAATLAAAYAQSTAGSAVFRDPDQRRAAYVEAYRFFLDLVATTEVDVVLEMEP